MKVEYDYLTVEKSFMPYRKHIFYLMATIEKEASGYVIASYSVKTDKIILKDCSNYIPDAEILSQFIEIAKQRYEESMK